MAETAIFLQPHFKRALYSAADRILASVALRGLRAAPRFAIGLDPISVLRFKHSIFPGKPFVTVLKKGHNVVGFKFNSNATTRPFDAGNKADTRSVQRV